MTPFVGDLYPCLRSRGDAKAVQHDRRPGLGERPAMPRPMPLVEPVTSETLPATAARPPIVRLDLDIHGLPFPFRIRYFPMKSPPQPGGRRSLKEMPFGFRNQTIGLSRFGVLADVIG